jgi:hypothetical protein
LDLLPVAGKSLAQAPQQPGNKITPVAAFMTAQVAPFILLTVTWGRDKAHFSLLRESLLRSSFAQIPHHVVVQHEDLELFREFPGVILHSSADVLPPEVEKHRRAARIWQARLGRRGTVVGGSLARHLGWPRWVRYTGWHTQQLSKLTFVAQSQQETVVILDSDVIVTPHAGAADFVCPEKIVCYEDLRPLEGLKGKVRHWQQTAHRLFDSPFPSSDFYDAYYDTPFVMHAPSLREMFTWLERRFAQPWWSTLLQQAPRRWSEFGIYKHYLRTVSNTPVAWRSADLMAYLFDAHNATQLAANIDRALHQQQAHYITVHSQSSGRQLWTAEDYQEVIRQRLTHV